MGKLVKCELKDCLHWKPAPANSGLNCDCQHKDKEMYMGEGRCPLYRQDWTSNQSNLSAGNLAERFRKKRSV